MNLFPNYPHPKRFRTYEDAMKFLKEPDPSLCIPRLIEKDTALGRTISINPEYVDANWEQLIIVREVR